MTGFREDLGHGDVPLLLGKLEPVVVSAAAQGTLENEAPLVGVDLDDLSFGQLHHAPVYRPRSYPMPRITSSWPRSSQRAPKISSTSQSRASTWSVTAGMR